MPITKIIIFNVLLLKSIKIYNCKEKCTMRVYTKIKIIYKKTTSCYNILEYNSLSHLETKLSLNNHSKAII